MRRFASMAAALLLTAAIVAGGCTPQKRPGTQAPAGYAPGAGSPTPAPATTTPTAQFGPKKEGSVAYPAPRAGSAYDDPSIGVSTIASAIPGAGRVTAVTMGNVALLGMPSTDVGVHRKVAEQIHASFPHIVEVRVTSDPAAIARLADVSGRISTQRTIAPYLPELASMSGSMTAVH